MIYQTTKVYPVSLEEAKTHLNIIGNSDDSEISLLLASSVDYVQGIVGRNLTSTGVTVVYGTSETDLELPDIEYGENGACFAVVPVVEETTADSENEGTSENNETAETSEVSEYEEIPISWSLSEDGKHLIIDEVPEGTESIVFKYNTLIAISETLRLAILMAIAFFYENRGDESGQKSVPLAAKNLALRERHSAV